MGTRVFDEEALDKKYDFNDRKSGLSHRSNRTRQTTRNTCTGNDTRIVGDRQDANEYENQTERFVGLGVGIASILAENVLAHPSIVLRRQCQVNHLGSAYHLTPFTLFPVGFNLISSQGMATIWKGLGSTFVVRGTVIAIESTISELTSFPKEMTRALTAKCFCQHLLVKALAPAIATPFFAASLPETVQSDIASEHPGVLDCLREGLSRVMGWDVPHTTRLIPIWQLVLPTATLHLCHYVIHWISQYTIISAVRSEQQNQSSTDDPDVVDKSLYNLYYPQLLSSFTGHLLAHMALYPMETVIHRLYIQGTRTIIDNVDTGIGVLPINTRYDGLLDCIKTMFLEEGVTGFYRGFGALVLQYCLHAVLLKGALVVLKSFSEPPNRRT